MALPTEITISGTLLRVDGTPEQGHVTFSSTVRALSSNDETVMMPSLLRADLALDGSFEITVPASDDPAWTPVGWVYNVAVYTSLGKSTFKTVVPYDAVNGLIEFPELLPAVGGGSALYAAFSHTHPGGGEGGPVTWNDITGKPSTFTPSTHTHVQADVTGLVASLSGKAATVHTHAQGDVTGLSTTLSGLATDISDLDGETASALSLKAPIASPTFTGTVSGITKAMVGLGNVDNTADASKPVSTATQTALNLKAPYFMVWNGSAYVGSNAAGMYVGPSDPGSVPDGSVWIDTDA